MQPHDAMPLTTQGAIIQHELFKSWLAAGFTDEQAMELLKTVITNVMLKGTE